MAGSNRSQTSEVKSRGQTFAERVPSKIAREIADPKNPYLAERVLWHGYDALDLMQQRSLVDVIYLLVKGELPTPLQARQLEHTLIILANPGPRHPATRAVMAASVSKTNPVHFLTIGSALMGGESLGAADVGKSIRFFRKNLRRHPEELAASLTPASTAADGSDTLIAPGFGSRYGGIDVHARRVAAGLSNAFPENEALAWGTQFAAALQSVPAGWLMTGIAAAMFVELGIPPNAGAGLFQLAACPGLLAHGMEMSGKPITAMPFVSDEDYHYEESAGEGQ